MKTVQLGTSDLQVTPICLGTMTFGDQVNEANTHRILSHSLARGINFIDTAEMYAVPPKAETFQVTEGYIGNWLANTPGARNQLIIASKVCGPSRGMQWIRNGSLDLTAQDILDACEGSLRRLKTDVIDLYQIHWPTRNTPLFGSLSFDPSKNRPCTDLSTQIQTMGKLIAAGKIRAWGLSNETPYGVHESVRLAQALGVPAPATVQNAYCLTNRTYENGLDETMYHLKVAMLAYSPLAFGLLTGKYDVSGTTGPLAPKEARITLFESMRKQRWGRAEALSAARRYNALAAENGLTPTQMALAFCYGQWRVASTIIGVTTIAQLDENLDAWGTTLSPELHQAIDAIRWENRDPTL